MEDHTVGNALRYVLMRKYALKYATEVVKRGLLAVQLQPDVDFCGYTIPRPSEPKMHMRLQTRQDLRKVSTQITDAYRKELKAFKRKNRTN
ncbi:hypothetical protein PRNP1_012045 [Phytophthora ramorum]